MEHVKKQEATRHSNSSNCTVYEFPMKTDEMNICVAEIAGRYPEQGYAINHQCSEMGYVLNGSGRLVTENQEVVLSAGDAVYIPPGEKYYWEGNITLVLPCAPAWNSAQHEFLKESKELQDSTFDSS